MTLRRAFRFAMEWAGGECPKTVLNAGFGIFYDRYQLANMMTTLESNGQNQIQTQIVESVPAGMHSGQYCRLHGGNRRPLGTRRCRRLRIFAAPYTLHYAVGVDQQLFRGATLSLNYVIANGVHQFYSANLNSPTSFAQVARPSIQPRLHLASMPLVQDTYQSGGVFQQQQLIANVNIQAEQDLVVCRAMGCSTQLRRIQGRSIRFPSIDPYDIGKDYGRAVFDVRYRVFMFGNIVSAAHDQHEPTDDLFSGHAV